MGACLRIITQALLRRSPNIASNSARPTVTRAAVGQGSGVAFRFDGGLKDAFGGQIRFNE
jgi:hypothetical protein